MKNVAIHLRLETASHRRRIVGIFRHVGGAGSWNIRIVPSEEGLRGLLSTTDAKDIPDGIISCMPRQPDTLKAIVRSGVPFVGIGMEERDIAERKTAIGLAANDNDGIGRAAANFFLRLGNFRSYVFVPDAQERPWSLRRGAAFADALAKAGKRCESCATDLAAHVAALPRPIAAFAAWDGRAADMLRAAHNAGLKVPDDISVLGVDDDDVICCHTVPTLSSIKTDAEGMGEAAAKMLDGLMSDRPPRRPPRKLCPIVGIAERGSTCTPAPASDLIQRAIAFIATEAQNGISPDDVARHLGISRRLLDLRFHQYESKSVAKTITEQKLERVKQLLADPDARVKDAFARSGFGNITYATELFRKKTGKSPNDWRRDMAAPATAASRAAVERLYGLSAEDASRLGELALQLSPDARFDAAALARSIQRGETAVFVLRCRSRIVASATAVCFATPTGSHCRIEDVVVDERRRGGGLGRRIMLGVLDALRAMNVEHVELTSRPSRVAATTMYRSLGFTPRKTGVYELHLRPDV